MATRYHLLPSEVMERASTLDIYVMETALSWQKYNEDQASAKANGHPPTPALSQKQMQEMLDRVRSSKVGHKNKINKK